VVGFRAGLRTGFQTAHLRRSTTGTIGRLEAQSFRDRLLPLLPTKAALSVHALAERLQFSLVVGPVDPLDPVRRPLDRPRCQQGALLRRAVALTPQTRPSPFLGTQNKLSTQRIALNFGPFGMSPFFRFGQE
jgi:hypothetical protein